jgi:hypothetical protein
MAERLTKESKRVLGLAESVIFDVVHYDDGNFEYLVCALINGFYHYLQSGQGIYRLPDLSACSRFVRRHHIENYTYGG